MTNSEIYIAVHVNLKAVHLSASKYKEFVDYLNSNGIGDDIEAYKGGGYYTVQRDFKVRDIEG